MYVVYQVSIAFETDIYLLSLSNKPPNNLYSLLNSLQREFRTITANVSTCNIFGLKTPLENILQLRTSEYHCV